MTPRSYALSALSITLLYGSLLAQEASLALPSSTPEVTQIEPAPSSSWNAHFEKLNTLWRVPHAKAYGALLGSENANAQYADRLQSFLKDLGIESSVAIKKLNPNATGLTLFVFDTKTPAIVSASGIWLNEALLSSMREAELIFELAYAAAAYHGLSFKNTAVDTLIVGLPYAAMVGINYMLYLRPTKPTKPSKGASNCIVKFLASGMRMLKMAALPGLNYVGITLGKNMVTKPLRAFCAKTVELDIVLRACDLLTANGYAWVVEEYTDAIKATLAGEAAVARMNANVPLRELFNSLNSFLLEHSKK